MLCWPTRLCSSVMVCFCCVQWLWASSRDWRVLRSFSSMLFKCCRCRVIQRATSDRRIRRFIISLWLWLRYQMYTYNTSWSDFSQLALKNHSNHACVIAGPYFSKYTSAAEIHTSSRRTCARTFPSSSSAWALWVTIAAFIRLSSCVEKKESQIKFAGENPCIFVVTLVKYLSSELTSASARSLSSAVHGGKK